MISVVISFCNEKNEVFNTIDSIRKHQRQDNEFIVINDCSDDDFDYETKFRDEYGFVKYFNNEKRIGSSRAKALGVTLASNDTVMVFDSHMRVYDDGFDIVVETLSKQNPKTLFCSENIILNDIDGKIIDRGPAGTWGARLGNHFLKEFQPAWNYKQNVDCTETKIPCILGASYVFQKSWFNEIRGFTGLIDYGYEEPLISVKSYMLGGDCRVIPDWFTGHVYRKKFPYKVNNISASGNLMTCYYQFLSKNGFEYYYNVFRNNYPEHFIFADKSFRKTLMDASIVKRFLDDNKVMGFEEYWKFNNEFIIKHNGPTKIVL